MLMKYGYTLFQRSISMRKKTIGIGVIVFSAPINNKIISKKAFEMFHAMARNLIVDWLRLELRIFYFDDSQNDLIEATPMRISPTYKFLKPSSKADS